MTLAEILTEASALAKAEGGIDLWIDGADLLLRGRSVATYLRPEERLKLADLAAIEPVEAAIAAIVQALAEGPGPRGFVLGVTPPPDMDPPPLPAGQADPPRAPTKGKAKR